MAQSNDDLMLQELHRISRGIALLATTGRSQKEQIAILSKIGFEIKEIAELLETTPNTVRAALVHIQKKGKAAKV
jgi:DNA-binding NarL/FixJ family response regulator